LVQNGSNMVIWWWFKAWDKSQIWYESISNWQNGEKVHKSKSQSLVKLWILKELVQKCHFEW
jgi:hypothetical protein